MQLKPKELVKKLAEVEVGVGVGVGGVGVIPFLAPTAAAPPKRREPSYLNRNLQYSSDLFTG